MFEVLNNLLVTNAGRRPRLDAPAAPVAMAIPAAPVAPVAPAPAVRGKAGTMTWRDTRGWSGSGQGLDWLPADALWEDWGTRQYEQLLARSSLVYACIRLIAVSASQVRMTLGAYDENRNWEEDTGNPALDLIYNPNPLTTYTDLIQLMLSRLMATGVSYVWKWRARGGWPAELWPLPTSWVKPVMGMGTQPLSKFVLEIPGKRPQDIAPEDMFWVGFRNPASVLGFLSPLAAGSRDVQLDAERENYLIEMLHNVNVPGLVLSQIATDIPMGPEQRTDLRESLYEVTGRGGAARGGTPILPPGVEATYPGLLEDLDWPGLSGMSEARVCAVLGTPAVLVGLRVGLEQSTYANYSEARKAFFQGTLVGLWNALDDALTIGLLRQEGDTTNEVRFNTDDVPELQEDATARSTRATQGFQGSLITRNEGRAIIGEPPDPINGDVYVVPMSMVEIPATQARKPEPTEAEMEAERAAEAEAEAEVEAERAAAKSDETVGAQA